MADGQPLLERCLQEGLSIQWDRVAGWLADGATPSKRVPSGISRREWRVDLQVLEYVQGGLMDIPAASVRPFALPAPFAR